MNNKQEKYIFKFTLLGYVETGKSSIVRRYIENIFESYNESTIGAGFYTKIINKDYGNIRIEIWDTAGQERYEALMPMYYRNSHICIIVYDITRRNTFFKAQEWVSKIKRMSIQTGIILVGNKNDIRDDRKIPFEEALEYSIKHNILFFETSAKTNYNIDKIFDAGCEYSYNYYRNYTKNNIDEIKLNDSLNESFDDFSYNKCCILL
jgi:Ras-related protein Rab-5C